MKALLLTLSILTGVSNSVNAQLPNGSIAPDFTLTDITGNTHHLYDYLNQGKVVFIELFACHCPSCWNYHLTGKLDELNQLYGPAGTDEIVVLMLEHDENNGSNEFNGISGNTQGDWVTGNSVPMINVEGTDRSVFDDYDLVYFTQLYKICPDKKTELMFSSMSVVDLYQGAVDCPGELSLAEQESSGTIHLDFKNSTLVFEGFNDVKRVTLFNSMGQEIISTNDSAQIDVAGISEGIYIVQVESNDIMLVDRVWIHQ